MGGLSAVIAAEVILVGLLVYVLCGLAVGVPFVLRGVERIDPSARGASIGFRLLILPGTVALWPFLTVRWLKRTPEGDHR